MAKERKPYTGGLVRPMGIPSVSFAQFQELATGASSMQRKLDTVVNFALKQEEAYQIKRGEEDAISNPVTANQYLDASPAEREALLGGEKYTSYGKSVQATQLTLLTSEMAIKAQKDFNALKVQAYTEEMNLDDYEANLNAIVNGYTDAIAPVNTQAAISIKSDLTTKANSFYSSYADKLLKDYKNFKDIEVVDYGQSLIDSISDEFAKGHLVTIIDTEGTAQQVSIDDHLNSIKNKYKIQLSSEGISKEDFVKWEAAWDAKVLQEKKNIIYGEFVDKPANLKSATQTMKVYNEVINGNFNGNQKLQSLYNSLDEDQQTEFKSTVRTWKNNSIAALEDAEKAYTIDIQNTKDDIEIKYLEAVRNRDYETANALVGEAKGIDDDLYLGLLKDIKEDVDQGDFLDTTVLSSLLDDLFAGTLNMKEIDGAYDLNQISLDQKRDLKEKLMTKKNSAFTAADKYMRNAFAYPEAGIITLNAEKSVAFEQYRNSANALMDFMFENPNATAGEIMAEAKNITQSINIARDTNNEIKSIKQEITKKGGDYALSHKGWTSYFRKFYKEDFTNVADEFLSTPGGIDLLITELEELKELENGMKYKVDENMVISEGGYFTDKFTRPGNLSNATINVLIDRLGVLKSYLEGPTE